MREDSDLEHRSAHSLPQILLQHRGNQLCIQFSYQGRSYKDFKHYTCVLAEGKNIRASDFTPGVPYYFQLASAECREEKDIE
jgi:hypothetical protein